MFVLAIIGAAIVGIGMLRVIFGPWRGFGSFFLELFLLDLMGDVLEWLIDIIIHACD